MKKLYVVPFFLALFFLMGQTGCDNNLSNYVQDSDIKLKLDGQGFTSEQNNVMKRLELSSEPNGLWWIYCLADNGQVVFYGPVKGKVTSSGKRLN